MEGVSEYFCGKLLASFNAMGYDGFNKIYLGKPVKYDRNMIDLENDLY